MSVRTILKANIGKIGPKKNVNVGGKEKRVVNVWFGENHYKANGDWSDTVWYYVGYWDGEADKFEEKGFAKGDYCEVDVFNLVPQAYVDANGTVHANIAGYGGYTYLIKKAEQGENLPQEAPPNPDEAVKKAAPETEADINARDKGKGSASKPA